MNGNEVMIYALLCDSIKAGKNPTFEEIAERLDLSVATARRGVRRLQQDGYIDVARHGRCNRYELTGRRPALFDRIRGWMYRFTANEANRRSWEAVISSRIFYKAHELRKRRNRDPDFIRQRDQLFAEYKNLCNVMATWPVEEALEIERRINELLDWGKKTHEQVPTLAAISDPAAEDGF